MISHFANYFLFCTRYIVNTCSLNNFLLYPAVFVAILFLIWLFSRLLGLFYRG